MEGSTTVPSHSLVIPKREIEIKHAKCLLVGGLVAMFYFPINIGFLIIPIDVHIVQRGGPTTNQYNLIQYDTSHQFLFRLISASFFQIHSQTAVSATHRGLKHQRFHGCSKSQYILYNNKHIIIVYITYLLFITFIAHI